VVDTRSAELPKKLDPRMVLLRAPNSPQAKSFRLLAHRARHSGDPRVMLVTSPRRGDGKTTCAVNLALSLAEDGGARVLLLEANSRAPSHAAMFGMTQVVGLPRQLARLETALVPWTTYALEGTRLHVLPCENDGVVLGRGVFAAALADLRNAFDYVIVDSSSVLDSADVMPLLDAVDGILLCARAKKTRARELERATKQLAPARVVGVVLLDVSEAAKT
jgi:Mrp family chromosome partitioning ATPase